MRKNSIKNTRVNAEVQRELSNILRGGIKDPRVAPLILRHARHISVFSETRKHRKIRSKVFRVQRDISAENLHVQ